MTRLFWAFYVTVILILFWIMAGDAEAAPEQRCTDLGAACVCSEPMNVNESVATGWNPSDSTAPTECTGKQYGIFLDTDAAPSELSTVPSGIGPAPQYALRTVPNQWGGPVWNLLARENPNATERRLCTRWYMRVDTDFSGAGFGDSAPNQRNKLFDNYFAGGENFQLEEWPKAGSGGGPGNYNPFTINMRGFAEADDVVTLDTSFTFDECRKDAAGAGGWCRLEFCTFGDIGVSGGGQVGAEFRAHSLDSGNTATVTTPMRTSATKVDRHHVNVFHGQKGPSAPTGPVGGFEVTRFMEAVWPTSSGQWIGAAVELEGVPDTDGDTIIDTADNCTLIANPGQMDSDSDGYGNACDCDYDQSGICGISDFGAFGACVNQGICPAVMDHDGNGEALGDKTRFDALYGSAPGPSGVAP